MEKRHLAFKALCVLHEAIVTARVDESYVAGAGVRLALALLWSLSDKDDRSSHDAFWVAITGRLSKPDEPSRHYIRATYAQTAFYGIARGVGFQPEGPMLSDAMDRALKS